MGTQVIIGVVIVLYLVMMILIGVVFSKGNDDAGDFYLGGRKLGPLVAAMSAEASDMSSWLLLGIPGASSCIYNCSYCKCKRKPFNQGSQCRNFKHI